MISFVVAMGKNGEIGINGTLPWYLPNDLKHFKRITEGHTIVMGRKTFESLPHILPNRHHVILTRDLSFTVDDARVTVLHSIDDMLPITTKPEEAKEYYVIGGADIFKQLLPFAEKIYLTILDQCFEADTYFQIDLNQWEVTYEQNGALDEKNTIPHKFLELERRSQ